LTFITELSEVPSVASKIFLKSPFKNQISLAYVTDYPRNTHGFPKKSITIWSGRFASYKLTYEYIYKYEKKAFFIKILNIFVFKLKNQEKKLDDGTAK